MCIVNISRINLHCSHTSFVYLKNGSENINIKENCYCMCLYILTPHNGNVLLIFSIEMRLLHSKVLFLIEKNETNCLSVLHRENAKSRRKFIVFFSPILNIFSFFHSFLLLFFIPQKDSYSPQFEFIL